MNPLVTVVIPTYKRSTILDGTIKSVDQNYDNIKIKVVDDNNHDTKER